MATPIREACLDENDQPNEVAERIQARFDADTKGCPRKIRGERCCGKLTFTFKELYPVVVCKRFPGHHRDAAQKQFCRFIKPELKRCWDAEEVECEAATAEATARAIAASLADVKPQPRQHQLNANPTLP